MENSKNTSRRKFLENSALGAIGVIGASQIIQSCSTGSSSQPIAMPALLDEAPDGQPLKMGLVGCGGRGSGAVLNFLSAGPNLSVHALADVFQDRVDTLRGRLKDGQNIELDDDKCFVGFDAYKRLLETDVDIVILATPPYFRPEHFQACVEARKHVFAEKPVAVDPVGARKIMAASKQAEAAGLCVVTGTQRRHQRDYLDIYSHVKGGAIGDIVSGNVYWNGAKLWHKDKQPGWTEMEAMVRDWVNWTWLSGDHIVEQHIHNIDVFNWFSGKTPLSALGMGSRQRRVTGDQYDNFSVDFTYEGEIHTHSMCRQINDCARGVYEMIRGTNGYTNPNNTIWNPDGSVMHAFEYVDGTKGKLVRPAMEQEHINLVTAIRTGEQIVTAEETAKSTLSAIMGRTSAYTGKLVTWDEMMESDMQLGPDKIELGPVDLEAVIPIPGSAYVAE